jgi:hypothetical protein
VESYYLDTVTELAARPQLAALMRGLLAAAGNPALHRAQEEMEQEILPWIDRVLAVGRASGAVRIDLPPDLLIAVAFGMGRAMDSWLMTKRPDDDALRPLIRALVGMLRRALQP